MIHLSILGVAIAIAWSIWITNYYYYKLRLLTAQAREEIMRSNSKYYRAMAWNLQITTHKIVCVTLAVLVPALFLAIAPYQRVEIMAIMLAFGVAAYPLTVLFYRYPFGQEVQVFYDSSSKEWQLL